ncbi:MAG: hypothetical protein HN613_03350 [Gammaproteobacteria bacterium]|jgi:hypothetical protein|nr:hypothetical protein [Gammaproteobacteria bacterium]MBT7603337.1 hypothetical protein [Gammaproteobacteria bacterium]
MKLILIIQILILNLLSVSYAEENIENQLNPILYHVKVIAISHNISSYRDFEENFTDDKYNDKAPIQIINNCILKDDITCEKFESDYKLDTFNEYKKILQGQSDLTIIDHLEWVQDSSIKANIKIKGGYDYSNEILDEVLTISDFDILSSGTISEYEGTVSIIKENFFQIHINIHERKRMKPTGFFATETLTSKNIVINQNIKLNKITYIDRDNFGFVVSIIKVNNI